MSNWLTSLGKNRMPFMYFVDCILWESSMPQGTYFILGEFMSGKYRKPVFLTLRTKFQVQNFLLSSLWQIGKGK